MKRVFYLISGIFLFTACLEDPSAIGKHAGSETLMPAYEVESAINVSDSLLQIFPVDECEKDPLLSLFLDTLKTCIANQDSVQFMSLLDPQICSSYGGGMYGYSDFRLNWQNKWPELWKKLDRIVSLGGFFYEDNGQREFRMPYVHKETLFNSVPGDCYSLGAITAKNVVLYEKADRNSRQLARLNYTAFEIVEPLERNGFLHIRLFYTGQTGFVGENDAYRMQDNMLVLTTDKSGRWKITALAPCD